MSMALEGDVRKSLLDRTDAEKVFRPWWDTLEDMLLNTLIALGEYKGTTAVQKQACYLSLKCIFYLQYLQ